MRGRGHRRGCIIYMAWGDGDGEGEGACEDEGEGGGACEHARARANARARASARGCIIYIIKPWRGARARWRGRRRGPVHGRGALQKHAMSCVQARSGTACKHAAAARRRHAKRTRGEASRRKRPASERFVDRNAKTCNAASRNEHHFLRIARTPCWFSTFKACTVELSKYLRK